MKKFTSVRVVEGFRDRKPSGSGVSNTIARQMGGFSGAGWYVVNEIGEDSGYAVTKVHDGPFTTFSDAAKSPSYSDTTQVVHLNKQGGLSEGFRDRTVSPPTKPKTLRGNYGWIYKTLGKSTEYVTYSGMKNSVDFRVTITKISKSLYDVIVYIDAKGGVKQYQSTSDTLFKAFSWAEDLLKPHGVNLPFVDDDVADLLVPWSDVP